MCIRDSNYSHEDISKFMDQTFGIEGVVVNDQELSLQLLLDLWNSIDLEMCIRDRRIPVARSPMLAAASLIPSKLTPVRCMYDCSRNCCTENVFP